MPTPQQDESRDQFIQRCIPIVLTEGTARNGGQAYAVCVSMYENRSKQEKTQENDADSNDIRTK